MKTTTKQYNLFKKYCKEYQLKFNLNNYTIYFELNRLKLEYANITINEFGKVATIDDP